MSDEGDRVSFPRKKTVYRKFFLKRIIEQKAGAREIRIRNHNKQEKGRW